MTDEVEAPVETPTEEPNLLGDAPAETINEAGDRVAPDGTVIGPAETPKPEGERPEWLPEKFKTPEDLAKSYKELERKLGQPRNPVPEKYELKLGEDLAELGEDDIAFFKEQKLSNDQAQAVLNYAIEQLAPELQKMSVEVETTRLASSWNMEAGSEAFKERLGKLNQWAGKNLPEEAVTSLRSSAQGVQALWSMMQAGIAAGAPGTGAPTSGKSKAELQSMVNDPRYWTDQGFREQVEAEFRRSTGR